MESPLVLCHLPSPLRPQGPGVQKGPPFSPPRPGQEHSRLLEAPHAVQDVELLPPFGKIHLPVNVIWVSQVNEGEVLQDEPPRTMEKPSYPLESDSEGGWCTAQSAEPAGRASAQLGPGLWAVPEQLPEPRARLRCV